MATSALGNSKPQSDRENGLKAKTRALGQTSPSMQSLSIGGIESTMNEVQKTDEFRLTIRCSTRDIEGDFSRANKHKVTMISSEMSFSPISDLREHLYQIRQAQ